MLPSMSQTQTIYLCMGSACHQSRGYQLLPVLEELIRRHGLGERLLLKGAFCLETCQQGRSLKFEDRVFTGLDENKLAEIFEREILPNCQLH
jgi:NADH:ubiquinone oxidoreductase subunit E